MSDGSQTYLHFEQLCLGCAGRAAVLHLVYWRGTADGNVVPQTDTQVRGNSGLVYKIPWKFQTAATVWDLLLVLMVGGWGLCAGAGALWSWFWSPG